ncbi:MAG TPA: CBS domain-containing protein [Candidatus Saccharimonadales bacterium]|nr:CBS domain-containing protein [Candidatus Saccharimonadales bacterium]
MIGILSGYSLIVIALLALALQRLYSSVPSRELKRLAKKGDQLAKVLYRPVAYGASLRAFLWFVSGVSMSAGLLLVLPHMPALLGFLFLMLIVVLSMVVVPSLRLTVHSAQFAALLAPAVVRVMCYVHAPFDYLSHLAGRYRELPHHSRLYEKEDLQELLERQEQQADNRMSKAEIDLARRALAFDDKHAEDIVRPRKLANLVDADEAIGPLLLDKLHQSGQSSFLVYKDEKDNIIGSLSMRDAVEAKQGGRVFDLVHSDLMFVHEDFTLRQVLGAFQKTGHAVGVVINGFEEFVGVVTLDDVIKELAGEPSPGLAPVDNYEDKGAVAAYTPRPSQQEQDIEQEPEATSPEATEVVE